jgi:hypothetical protein
MFPASETFLRALNLKRSEARLDFQNPPKINEHHLRTSTDVFKSGAQVRDPSFTDSLATSTNQQSRDGKIKGPRVGRSQEPA